MNLIAGLEQGGTLPAHGAPGAIRAGMIVTLHSGQSALLQLRAPADIRCLRGTLWITRSPEIGDTVLQAGQRQAMAQAGGEVLLSSTARSRPVTVEIIPSRIERSGLRRLLKGRRPHFQLQIA